MKKLCMTGCGSRGGSVSSSTQANGTAMLSMTGVHRPLSEASNLLIAQTTKNLDKIERKKYEILITVHMHQRDVFESLVKMNIKNPNDFEWLKQSRFYFRQDIEQMHICITDVTFAYQNEFLG